MQMQTSMGQAASSLSSLLDMPSEVTDGDREKNLEKSLLQARKELTDAVSSAGDHGPAVTKLLHLQCPIALKYAQLSVGQMLKENCESVAQIKTIPQALGILEKYGRHLLKPRERRAELWRQIKFSNAIFKDRVLPMKGSLEVVRQMGYTVEIDDGLQFEGDEPDAGSTSRLVADIVLARLEMERYLTGTHPHAEVISDLLPQTTINQLQAMWSTAAQASTVNGKQEPPLSSQKLLPQPVQVSGATQQSLVTSQDDSVHPFHMTELPLDDKTDPVDVSHLDDSMRRACDICGNRPAAVWCHSCDNKQLCDACDDMWHKHPKRLNHQRQSITSLPSPSVSTAAGLNIQGPFGIRAVDSLKHLSTNHRQASAQDSSPGNVPVLRTNDSSVDPLRNQQMPFDASSSLLQHQQQLQHYHQIQQQQQKQQFDQMPEYSPSHHPYYNAMIGNTGQHGMQNMMLPAPEANSPRMGQPVVHPAYLLAQNISHPEHTTLFRHSGPLQHSVAPPFLPNYMWSGLQQHNLNAVPVQTGRDPLIAATNSSMVGVHYCDLSLRRSGHSIATLEGPPAVGTESTNLLGEAGKGGKNMRPRSLPENRLSLISSPLLSRVIAESNYEKRAAKCEIHLMALKEELQEVDDALNALMLNNDEFCELEEFRSLNKRKAMLIREYNTLSQYKQELAKIIDSGVYGVCRNDPDMSSEVFHPPAVVSPSTILVKPQISDLSTQLQSQVDFLQQGSQPPLKKQEQSVFPSHSLRHVALTPGNIKQSDFSQNVLPCLENVDENCASGDSRSSVDRRSILPQWKMDPSGLVHGDGGYEAVPVSTEQQVMMNLTPPHQVSSAASSNCVYTTLASQKHQVAIGSNSTEKPAQRDEVLKTVSNLGPLITQQGTGDFHGDRTSTWMAEAKEVGMQFPVTKPKMQPHAEQNMPLLPVQPLAPPSMKVPASHFGRFKPPGDNWQCNHCTLINSPGTRICEACDRTSDNPTLISSHSSSENDLKTEPTQIESKAELPSADSASAEGKVPDGSIKSMQLEKLHSKLAAEQDKVYLEKKEAQHRYSMMLQAKSEQQHSAPSSHHDDSCVTSQQQPHPPVPKKSLQSATQGTHLSAADDDSGFVSEKLACSAYENKTELCAVTRLKQNDDRQRVSLESGGSNSSSSSLRSGELASFNEGNFQQTMERFSEQKKIKQMQIDGAEILHFVKMADRYGFSFTEICIALEKFDNDSRAALTWLQTEWEKLVDVVISTVKTEGQRSQHNDVGELSREEAQEALRECGGELVPAVKKCTAKRRAMYARLNPDSTFAREEVLQAMLQCQGNEEGARQHLQNTLLQPFLQRVWQGMEEDELGGTVGVGRSLLQMAIAETCQSVSTSVISHEDFQQRVKDKTLDRERRIRMVLVEGKLRSWGRAELVIKLLDHDLPAAYSSQGITNGEDYYCTLEDVVEAVRNCEDKRSALVYLMQECQICFSHYPMSKIRNLNFCQCKICSDCLKQNFEVVIREKHVRHWTCPLCSKPDLNDEELGSEYINFLGMLLQMQVDKEVYDLFETKVRDWHLQKDPHFRWCAHCGNGFIADGGDRQLKMVCPHCSQKTCYQCKKQWEEQHEGVTCEQFAQWKIDNDPNNQAVGLARHLEENGIDCPSCKMRYALAKGGCMHFKCPQCGHEFCSGCCQPFYQRGMCNRLKNCKMNGLHAHHPRDCFFYLRDCDVQHLQVLLQNANVEFNTVPPANQEETSRCPVIEQKEFDSGKRDESCGKDSGDGLAGLCLLHYKEYLVGLINKNNIDPAMSMNIEELRKVLARGEMNVPKQKHNESSAAYHKRIIKLVQEKMPLPPRSA